MMKLSFMKQGMEVHTRRVGEGKRGEAPHQEKEKGEIPRREWEFEGWMRSKANFGLKRVGSESKEDCEAIHR